MQAFQQLTKRGQARRLRKLALRALEQYPLDVADVHLVGTFTNTLFRVRAADGTSYVLRVCTPGWRTETDLRSEAMWLAALAHETDIGAPVPLAAYDGSYLVEARAEGVPEVRRCMVTSWLPGSLLGKQLTEANLYKMGVLFGRLHAHGARFCAPPGFTERKMDGVYARDEQEVLWDCDEGFTPESRAILERAWSRVEGAFARLYADPAGLRVIHHDLWHDNIVVYRGHLHPFDFEDTAWGYPVQDVAMALQDLMMDVEADAFGPLQAALRQGYESLAPWPERCEGEIDTFRVGRLFWVANYVARYQRVHLREHIKWTAQLFAGYLETGRLRKQ
ncbi:MAG: phosphotransferase enzyme family protein [Anaerolineae bacterium]|jgi:Ser/Thr protein kinase RdoA (MazF antagonist)